MAVFYETLTKAIADISQHGYDSQARLEYWIEEIRKAAVADLVPPHILENALNTTFRAIYTKQIENGGILKFHPSVPRFMLERIKPRLRNELDRSILASANLIKLNRQDAVNKTLQRFSGWATSIQTGGSRAVDKPEVKDNIRKSMAQLPFEERRVLIDQGHKFTSGLNSILATDGGAIAARWHSNYQQAGYNYRKDHKERNDNVYAIRGNWAIDRGLMKPGPYGYTDAITKPGEEVFCRCHYEYIYNIRDLPADMVTAKGRSELERVRVTIHG